MTGKELWNDFSARRGLSEDGCEEWAFGVEADLLAELVVNGVKTATASAYPLYELENEPLPVVGAYSVILDSKEQAVCVIRTTRVAVTPFCEVSEEHAYREGEGDRSLRYWREVHEKIFSEWMSEAGLLFTPNMPVVCEEFEVVYMPQKEKD